MDCEQGTYENDRPRTPEDGQVRDEREGPEVTRRQISQAIDPQTAQLGHLRE